MAYRPDIFNIISKEFIKIFNKNIQFRINPDLEYLGGEKILVTLNGKDYFPLTKISDGYFQVLLILFQIITSEKDDIIIIDEPELHLHPGATKALQNLLDSYKRNRQIILSTHSPIFLAPQFIDNYVLFSIKDESVITNNIYKKDISLIIEELGISGLDALLYDIVIWVEGKSDIFYIRKWLELSQEHIPIPTSYIGIIEYGGKDQLHEKNLDEILKINNKSIFIIDSDKKSRKNNIPGRFLKFKEECEKRGIYCWITEKREIENYIPIDLVKKVYGISDEDISIGDYDDFFDIMKKDGKNFLDKKIKLAKDISFFPHPIKTKIYF